MYPMVLLLLMLFQHLACFGLLRPAGLTTVENLLQVQVDLALGMLAASLHDEDRLPLGLVAPAEGGVARTLARIWVQCLQHFPLCLQLPVNITELAVLDAPHWQASMGDLAIHCQWCAVVMVPAKDSNAHLSCGPTN